MTLSSLQISNDSFSQKKNKYHYQFIGRFYAHTSTAILYLTVKHEPPKQNFEIRYSWTSFVSRQLPGLRLCILVLHTSFIYFSIQPLKLSTSVVVDLRLQFQSASSKQTSRLWQTVTNVKAKATKKLNEDILFFVLLSSL